MAHNSLLSGVGDKVEARILVKILSNAYDGFKVYHLNASRLSLTKLDYGRHTFIDSGVDIICVSETWFKFKDSEDDYLYGLTYMEFQGIC